MLENGRYLGAEPDRLGRPDIKAIHRFGAAVDLAGNRVDAILTVRETRDGRFFYDLNKDRDARLPESEQETLQVRDQVGTPRAAEENMTTPPDQGCR
jgi:hypothetical protein